MSDLRSQTISGLVWKFAERCGAQGVSFVVSIVLARLLAPEDYGTIALVTVFTNILQVFVDSGMGNALIQKKDADDLDFSSVFYFNVVACLVLYGILFVIAPYIALFYGRNDLTPVIRALSLTIVISGVKNIQQAYVSRNMLFKRFFFSTLGGTIGAAIVGIGMAYLGFGVWALVAQQLFNTLVDTVILWITVKWRPKLKFSFSRLKALFSFGWKLLASSLINTVYGNIRQLVIGKMYSSSDLAYFNKGQQFPNLIVTNINTSIDSVLLPVMSKCQDKEEQVRSMTRRSIKISSYIMWPMMIGLFVVAEPFVELILTEKWLGCVPFLRIYCLTYGLEPIQTANLNAIKALGRSDIYMKLEIIKKIVGLLILVVVMKHGVLAIGYSILVYTLFASVMNSYPNKKLLNYSYFEQIRDILPAFVLACVMGCIVYPISMLNLNNILIIILQIFAGVVVYVAGSKIMHMESFEYVLSLLKRKEKH